MKSKWFWVFPTLVLGYLITVVMFITSTISLAKVAGNWVWTTPSTILTLVFEGFALCALIALVIWTAKSKISAKNGAKEFKQIEATYEPDEIIRLSEAFMKRRAEKLREPDASAMKCLMFCHIGSAYSSKGDYEKALSYFDLAYKLIPLPECSSKRATEICALALLAGCLGELGRIGEAEAIFSRLSAPPNDEMNYCVLQLASSDLLLKKGNTARVRLVLEDIKPKMLEISQKLNRPDIMSDITLTEGLLAKAEGDYELAKLKLTETLTLSKNYGVDRRAKEALKEIGEFSPLTR